MFMDRDERFVWTGPKSKVRGLCRSTTHWGSHHEGKGKTISLQPLSRWVADPFEAKDGDDFLVPPKHIGGLFGATEELKKVLVSFRVNWRFCWFPGSFQVFLLDSIFFVVLVLGSCFLLNWHSYKTTLNWSMTLGDNLGAESIKQVFFWVLGQNKLSFLSETCFIHIFRSSLFLHKFK